MNMNEIAPLRVWCVAKAIPEIKMLKEIKLCSGIAFERGEQITLFLKIKQGGRNAIIWAKTTRRLTCQAILLIALFILFAAGKK